LAQGILFTSAEQQGEEEALLVRKRNQKSSHLISCHLSIYKTHLDATPLYEPETNSKCTRQCRKSHL